MNEIYPSSPPRVDYGADPFFINIDEATTQNKMFRRVVWTGANLQLAFMSIDVDSSVGLDIHPRTDQFVFIEEGQGIATMGEGRENQPYKRNVSHGYGYMIPAGIWHNLINVGAVPIKLSVMYGPPLLPKGTVHPTKADAEIAMREY